MRKIITFVLFFCVTFVFASPVDQLNQILENIHSLSANFQQSVVGEDGKTLQQSSGTVQLSRPGRFRWATEKPLAQIIITNGKLVWVYEPDLQQVTIKNLQTSLTQTPLLLLIDPTINLSQQFDVTSIQKQSVTWFDLIPKDQSEMFKTLNIAFSQNKLVAMSLQNNLGQTTSLKFSNVVLNKNLSTSLFNFSVPKGVDIVDMRQSS